MKKIIVLTITSLLLAASVHATKVSNVKVDFIKGYSSVDSSGTAVRCYMGRVTYTLLAEGKDSVAVDISIAKQGTQNQLEILEKTGDVGLVKQKTAADTAKTAYFRAKVVGDQLDNYVATVTADANASKIKALADSLVKKMTLQQRESLLYANGNWHGFGSDDMTLSDNTLIVGWRCSDGPHGVRWPIGPANDIAIYGAGDTVTLFPTEAALGCTWDTAMTRNVGQAIAQEARAMGLYCLLGPMCDLVVNPQWGRAFETMGEDPYLNGCLVSSQIWGLQSERVIATPKHFSAYVKENQRYTLRVNLSERALRELYCVPFEMALLGGGARALMTCYNRVNVPGFTSATGNQDAAPCNSHLIDTIVRKDWGFDGLITSDWDAMANGATPNYTYYIGWDMSNPSGINITGISQYVPTTFPEGPLDTKASHVMAARLWAWGGKLLANDAAIKTYPMSVVKSKEHLAVALAAAREAIVLAKNDAVGGTPLLPLNKNGAFKLAVVGPYASVGRPGGGGSSAVTADSIISPLLGIQRMVAGNSSITVQTSWQTADVVVYVAGVDKESEDFDRTSMSLPSAQLTEISTILASKTKTIVVYTGGSASAAGSWSNAPGVVIAFYPGRWQGQAIAEVLFGAVNPSGHLGVTFPAASGDLPSFDLDANLNVFITGADTAHGYFLYEKKNKKPLFWFGHGLSYTTFKYNNIAVSGPTTISAGDRVDIAVAVQNTGALAGDDVVQLYVRPVNSTVPRRVKDLRGFTRLSLQSGAYAVAHFTLGPRDFSVYDVNDAAKTGSWKVMPGAYDILVGSTSNPDELVNGNGKCVSTTITVQ